MTLIHTFNATDDNAQQAAVAACGQVQQQARALGFEITPVILDADMPGAERRTKLLLTAGSAPVRTNLASACSLPVDGLHLDALAAHDAIDAIDAIDAAIAVLGPGQVLSLGVIDGCSAGKTDLHATLAWLEPLQRRLGERLWIAPACPPPAELAGHKLAELRILAQALDCGRSQVQLELVQNAAFIDRARAVSRAQDAALA